MIIRLASRSLAIALPLAPQFLLWANILRGTPSLWCTSHRHQSDYWWTVNCKGFGRAPGSPIEVLQRYLNQVTEEIHKTSVRKTYAPAGIRTEHAQNTRLERYRYANLLDADFTCILRNYTNITSARCIFWLKTRFCVNYWRSKYSMLTSILTRDFPQFSSHFEPKLPRKYLTINRHFIFSFAVAQPQQLTREEK
jgi:hypothetical protein